MRSHFVHSDQAFQGEIIAMTDHSTMEMFITIVPQEHVVPANVCCLANIEPFMGDRQATVAAPDMGAGDYRTSTGPEIFVQVSSGSCAQPLRLQNGTL